MAQKFDIYSDVFLNLWKSAKISDQAKLINKLSKRQVQQLRKNNLLSPKEIKTAAQMYPECFSMKELTPSLVKKLSLQRGHADLIAKVKRLTKGYIEEWISAACNYKNYLKPSTMQFVIDNKMISWDQKMLILWSADLHSYTSVWWVKLWNAAAKDSAEAAKRIFCLRFFKTIEFQDVSKEEEKEIFITAFDEAYKFGKIPDSHGGTYRRVGIRVLNCIDDAAALAELKTPANVATAISRLAENIFDSHYNLADIFDLKDMATVNERVGYVRTMVQGGEYTRDDLKRCHLEYLLNASERIMADL